MKERLVIHKSASLDKDKLRSSQEIAKDVLAEKIDGLVKAEQMTPKEARMATIFLSGELGLMRKEALLDKYSQKEITDAGKKANEAITAGSDFGKYIQALRGGLTDAPPSADKPAEISNETREAKLVRLALVAFNTGSPTLSGKERNNAAAFARRAIAHIASKSLKMNEAEVGALLGVVPISTKRFLEEARQEYVARDSFYDRVQAICDELGVRAP